MTENGGASMEELTPDHLVHYCRQAVTQAMDYVRSRMRKENLPASSGRSKICTSMVASIKGGRNYV